MLLRIAAAVQVFRLARKQQLELEDRLRKIGVICPEAITTKVTKVWVAEAMKTSAQDVADKYAPVVRSVILYEGRTVSPKFNKRLFEMLVEKECGEGVERNDGRL
jgi:hypothetical protein